jgi:maltose-binding protein MalE
MRTCAAMLSAVVMVIATVSLMAHQETFKGKVMSVARASVQVNVLDPKTKKETPRTFTTNEKTKVLRGDTVVTLANAKIQKDENIAVTVDHDVDVNLALVVRLDAVK